MRSEVTRVEPQNEADEIEALMRPMLNKRLFVVTWSAVDQPDLIRRHLLEHLRYIVELERSDVLFASGPFSPTEDVRLGDGMTILRAESADQARAIAEQDPFVRQRARTFSIKQWTINEGSLSVKVKFSDTSVILP